jgi:peptidyl-prolyl cis-trans isomerase D
MAVISAIRKRTGLVLTLIAVAVIGFLLMDMLQGNSRTGGSSSDNVLGKVAGQKIDRVEFFNMENALYQGGTADVFARREYLWNFFTERAILEEECRKIGIRVEKNELMESQFGTNLASIVTARFTNPNTGQVDMAQLSSIKASIEKNSLDPTMRPFWAAQEKEIIKERMETKLANLVAKAIYTPKWQAEMDLKDNNDKVNFQFAQITYDQIPDSEVEVTDKDLDAFVQKNKAKYKQKEEKRILEYIVMDVIPNAEDSAKVFNEVAALKEGFAAAENDTLFLETNLGVLESAYMKKSDLPASQADDIAGLAKGEILGPFQNENMYTIVKMLNKKAIPDSVKSRHILLRVSTQEEFATAQAKIDSIKTVIESKQATFEAMAQQFSTDGSAANGGDLGYAAQGTMVKPFNDMIFFGADPGELKVVFTQFGIHLVEVTDRKFINNEMGYNIGIINREIVPSEETQKEVEDLAYSLLNSSKNLSDLKEALKGKEGLRTQSSTPVSINSYIIPSISEENNVREMIRWAFASSRKEGDVSGEVYGMSAKNTYYTNKYIVVGLKTIIPEGVPSGKALKDEIELLVKNEKKFQIIADKIKGKNISEAAAAYGTEVKTMEGATFINTFITDAGNEPTVVATACGTALNKTSNPIKGNAGVYVVSPTNKEAAGMMFDASFIRNTTQMSNRRNIEFTLVPALVEKFKIKDNRFASY